MEHLVAKWNVANIQGLSSEGHKAQDYLCSLPDRIRRLEERAHSKVKKGPKTGSFSWIFNREVALL
jgi:acyl-[acyl-carrier-protein] desaturase